MTTIVYTAKQASYSHPIWPVTNHPLADVWPGCLDFLNCSGSINMAAVTRLRLANDIFRSHVKTRISPVDHRAGSKTIWVTSMVQFIRHTLHNFFGCRCECVSNSNSMHTYFFRCRCKCVFNYYITYTNIWKVCLCVSHLHHYRLYFRDKMRQMDTMFPQ